MFLCILEHVRVVLVAKAAFICEFWNCQRWVSRAVSDEMWSSSFSSRRDCMHMSCVGVWVRFYPSFSAADTLSLSCLVSKNNKFDALRLFIITLDQIDSREHSEEVVGSGANPSVSDKSPYFQMHFCVCMHAPIKQYIIFLFCDFRRLTHSSGFMHMLCFFLSVAGLLFGLGYLFGGERFVFGLCFSF